MLTERKKNTIDLLASATAWMYRDPQIASEIIQDAVLSIAGHQGLAYYDRRAERESGR